MAYHGSTKTESHLGEVDVASITAGDTNIGNVDVASIAAGETHVGAVGGHPFLVSTEKTRPEDTTGYAANDAVSESASAGTVWTATNIARVSGGGGTITKAEVATDDSAVVVRYEIDLYNTSITAINDNAEATRLYANQASFIGTITFPAAAKKTANSNQAEAVNDTVRMPFVTSGSRNLFYIVRMLDADASPVSAAKVRVNLSGYQD